MRRITLAVAVTVLPLAAPAEALDAAARPEWKAAVYVDAYLPPGEDPYLIPTLFADRGPLHLEARWNYEDLDTASVFAGWTFGFGDEETFLTLTPMLGGVAGNVNGVAPGLEVEAGWGRLAYWLEAEYVLDLEDSSANYLYTWSELALYALDWLWVGASAQRLKPVASETEVDLAPMVGVGEPDGDPVGWSLSFYAYGLTKPEPTYLLTGAVTF